MTEELKILVDKFKMIDSKPASVGVMFGIGLWIPVILPLISSPEWLTDCPLSIFYLLLITGFLCSFAWYSIVKDIEYYQNRARRAWLIIVSFSILTPLLGLLVILGYIVYHLCKWVCRIAKSLVTNRLE